MFFYVSKTLWLLLTPSNFIILLVVLGIVLLRTRWRVIGRWLAGLGVMLLLVVGFSPLGIWLSVPLELRFEKRQTLQPDAIGGIIILGGVADERLSPVYGSDLEVNGAGERILTMIALANRFPGKPILFTGGTANVVRDAVEVEADTVRRRIAQYGVEPERILFENQSRNTHENAIFSKPIVPAITKPWLLVTSAMHMPRAVGVFRHAGYDVIAYPVDYTTAGWDDVFRLPFAVSEGLGRTDGAIREWIGLFVYRLTGKTSTFFPEP
jgi:uncharacterized SAM-binding protein YcdF (DUF218 family)